MKNETVKEFIERLKLLDQDAIVCYTTLSEDCDDYYYSTLQNCNYYTNVHYIDDSGNNAFGNIVTFM